MKSFNLQVISLCVLGMFINILYSQSMVDGVKPGVNSLHLLPRAHSGEYDPTMPVSRSELEERFNRQLHKGKSQLIHNNYLYNEKEGVPKFEGKNFAKQRVEELVKTYSSSFIDSAIAEDTDGSRRKWVYTFDINRNMTSKLFQMWDSSQWVNDWEDTYTYDASGNMITLLYQIWDGSQWVYSWQWINTYDITGKEISSLSQNWDGNQWINLLQGRYINDTNGNWISRLYKKWDGSQWVNDWQSTFTYDTDGNIISESSQNWIDSQWVNDWQYTYTYNTDGNMISKLYQFDWDGSQWVNDWQDTYTYDTDRNMISRSSQDWIDSQLVDSWQDTYAYDANGNMISVSIQDWDGYQLRDGYQYIYTYDIDGNMISRLSKSWNGSHWMNTEQETYTYDIFSKVLISTDGLFLYGKFTSYLYQIWDGSQWVKKNYKGLSFQDFSGNYFNFYGAQITIFYNTTTGIKDNDNIISGFSLSQNYPNPFNPVTTINYSLPKNSNVKLEVFDVIGRKVQTLVDENKSAGEHKVVFNAADYSNGTYFYRFHTEEFRNTKSMILIK